MVVAQRQLGFMQGFYRPVHNSYKEALTSQVHGRRVVVGNDRQVVPHPTGNVPTQNELIRAGGYAVP